jgi:secreted protein with Ig-like and vWFA domain
LLLFLLVAEWLAEKQQIHILLSLVWSDRSSNPRLTTPRGERTADAGL